MIKERPIGVLVLGVVASLIIGFTVSRMVFGYWLWEKSIVLTIFDVILSTILLILLWWWIWRPKDDHATD